MIAIAWAWGIVLLPALILRALVILQQIAGRSGGANGVQRAAGSMAKLHRYVAGQQSAN